MFSHQIMVEQKRGLVEENEELKNQIAFLSDMKTKLETESEILRRNNTSLKSDNTEFQSQVGSH